MSCFSCKQYIGIFLKIDGKDYCKSCAEELQQICDECKLERKRKNFPELLEKVNKTPPGRKSPDGKR